MGQTFDIDIRVLSCESCGAPVNTAEAGGMTTCTYCGRQMMIAKRELAPVRVAHGLTGEARIAKLRMQTGRDLPDNPYSTVKPPPGCEGLTRSGLLETIEQLAVRLREAVALVRADSSFEHQRLLWWCATMLNQGYGMHDKQLERRAVLERAVETVEDPGFRHLLYINLAGAAARAGELGAARSWIEKCDPAPPDIMLDSAYRVGLASVLVREGDVAQTLALVGAKVGDVPEAHQYRMMFALYRIHAHEQLGDQAAALAAAATIQADPQIGGLLVEALRLNDLGPKTATAIEAPGTASPAPPSRAPSPAASAPAPAGPAPAPAGPAPNEQLHAAVDKLHASPTVDVTKKKGSLGLWVVALVLFILGTTAVVIYIIVVPALRDAGVL